MPTVRPALPTELGRLAELQSKSWKTAYAGSFPTTFLEGEIPDLLRKSWEKVSLRGQDVVLVAEDGEDGEIIGFIAVWSAPMPLIDNLHVLPSHQRQGIGGRLMAAAASELVRRGHRSAYLYVFRDNLRAIDFYRSLGGKIAGHQDRDIFGFTVPCLRIEWETISFHL